MKVQKIETIFADVYVYEVNPVLHHSGEAPYLVIDVDTASGVDRRVKVVVDGETVFSGEVEA